MKRIKNLIISMLAVVLLVGMTSFALGASVNTSIVPEKSKVKAGETFTVTVKFSGGDVGRVKALMDYDSTKLSYLGGGSSEGDNGTISIRKAGDGKDITAKLKFKALNSGKTSLNISRLEAYDLDEQKLEGTKAGAFLTVEPAKKAKKDKEKEKKKEKKVKEPAEEEQPEENVADENSESENVKNMPIFIGAIGAVCLLLLIVLIISGRKKKRR